jgi:predicted nucleotidyltransferase
VIDESDLADAIRGVQTGQPAGVHVARGAAAPYGLGSDRPAPVIDPWLTTIVGRVVRAVDPIRIILFGARAGGEARADSDYELLVVLDDVPDRMAARVAVRRSFADIPVPADIVVASVDEIAGHPSGVLYWALEQGRSVYARDTAR